MLPDESNMTSFYVCTTSENISERFVKHRQDIAVQTTMNQQIISQKTVISREICH